MPINGLILYLQKFGSVLIMMCMCAKQKPVVNPTMINRKTQLPINFERQQMEQLHKKFKKVAGDKLIIDRQAFLKNMGILGLHSIQGFSDRLFNSFDLDNDFQISFQDFVQYMAILKSGTDHEKALISFKLIDHKNKSKIDEQDFKQFLQDFFRSWATLTNLPITYEIRERMDTYVKIIFDKAKKKTDSSFIDFQFYSENLYNKDRQFMEAFQFITRGVGGIFLSQNRPAIKSTDYDKLELGRQFLSFINELENIYETAFDKLQSNFKVVKNEYMNELQTVFEEEYPKVLQTIKYKNFGTSTEKQAKFSKKHKEYQFNFTQDNNVNSTYDTKNKQVKNNSHKQRFKRGISQKINDQVKQCNLDQCHTHKKILQSLKQKLGNLLKNVSEVKKELKQEHKIHASSSPSIFTQQQKPNVHYSNIKNSNKGSNDPQQNLSKKKRKFNKTKDLFQLRVTQGNMIFIGDQNWNLVLNMMIGIQMAVRSVNGYTEMLYEQPKDFNLRYYFQLIPRRFGDDQAKTIFSFTDYAPNTFNHIRKTFNIDNEEYINSIGPNRLMASLMLGEMSSMAQLTSQGKSGSFFYYTADAKYMLKTIKQKQYRFFRSILKDYFFHLKDNPKSLITKFYGLHKLSQKNQSGQFVNKCYFVIMGNVFNTRDKIQQRYDIKGSTYGRQNQDPHPNATRKDLDFIKRGPLSVSTAQSEQIMKILRADAQFFQTHNIIDYSLLIGVIKNQNNEQQKLIQTTKKKEISMVRNTIFVQGQTQKYLFGVIDILTQYDSKKVMEYWFKKMLYGQGISAVPPQAYAKRFISFIEEQIFQKQLIRIEKIPNNNSKFKQQKIIPNANYY